MAVDLIENIKAYDPSKASDDQLRDDQRIVVGWFASYLDPKKKIKFSKKEILEIYVKILKELLKRKKKNPKIFTLRTKGITEAAKKLRKLAKKYFTKEDWEFLKSPGIKKTLTPSDIPYLLKPGMAPFGMPGMILVEPHGQWIFSGEKKAIVKSRKYSKYIGVPIYVIQKDLCYGIIQLNPPIKIDLEEFRALRKKHKITEEERKRWWPGKKKFYYYTFKVLVKFKEPKKIVRPKGSQVFIEQVVFKKLNLEDLREMALRDIQDLGKLVVIPDYVSLVGSTVQRDDVEPNDIDIVIRKQIPDVILERKIASQFDEKIRDKLHFIYHPAGPTSSYIPLYDLVLAPKENFEVVKIEEEYPLKSKLRNEPLKLEEITPKALKKLTDKALLLTHYYLHHLWRNKKEKRIPSEAIVNPHIFVVKEMEKRGLKHHITDSLDTSSVNLRTLNLAEPQSLIPGRPFQPLKSGGGYGEGEFGDSEVAWRFGAQGFEKMALEFKYDGNRMVIHKKGDKVWIFSEDAKKNYADRLPQVVEEIKKINH
ncbi:hypothetical protein J7L09_01495, partial [bacterium]|nr:hypothetical protein [bacterium]